MSKETLVWNKVLATILKMPGVKIDRVGFLRQELRPYCNQSRLQMLGSVRPYTVVSEEVVDKLARQCIRRHTTLATATSTVAGLPGGLAMAATMPADLTQYFYHLIVLSQKLAYLYGYPDFCEDDGELSDMATDLLTIFMGVMMGAPVAEKGIDQLSKAVAESAVTRLPRVALTKTAILPIATQIARLIGMKLSKDSFAKGIGRFLPIAGGLFAGGLTLFSFSHGAKRLRRQLRAQRHLFKDEDSLNNMEYETVKTSFVKSAQAERSPQQLQVAVIQAMSNMAKINDDVTPERYRIVEQQIARAKISGEQKLELLAGISSEQSYDVDFDLIATDEESAKTVIEGMVSIAKTGDKVTTAEKLYLSMAAQKLGFPKEQIDEELKK